MNGSMTRDDENEASDETEQDQKENEHGAGEHHDHEEEERHWFVFRPYGPCVVVIAVVTAVRWNEQLKQSMAVGQVHHQ